MKKLLLLVSGLVLTLTLAACGGASGELTAIVGIEPGAGMMSTTEDVIEEYGLALRLDATSEPVMLAELAKAIAAGEDIVVTGWAPHYMFAMFDLKILEDPLGLFGSEEKLYTVARADVRDDFPLVADFFEDFFFDAETIGDLMGAINESSDDALTVATAWMEDNKDVWESWIPEGLAGDGRTINIDYVNWAEGVAMTHLAGAILIEYGFDVKMADLEPGVLFQSLASGQTDFFLDAWLPVTHADYMAANEGKIINIGLNYEGAKLGLVVPAYMDIDSIDDLPKND
jgi:glycine betaine/proline transport system substrate-binding protein